MSPDKRNLARFAFIILLFIAIFVFSGFLLAARKFGLVSLLQYTPVNISEFSICLGKTPISESIDSTVLVVPRSMQDVSLCGNLNSRRPVQIRFYVYQDFSFPPVVTLDNLPDLSPGWFTIPFEEIISLKPGMYVLRAVYQRDTEAELSFIVVGD